MCCRSPHTLNLTDVRADFIFLISRVMPVFIVLVFLIQDLFGNIGMNQVYIHVFFESASLNSDRVEEVQKLKESARGETTVAAFN